MLTVAEVIEKAKATGLLEVPYTYKIEAMQETNDEGQELYRTYFCNRSWSNYCTLEEVDDEIEEINTYRNLFPCWTLFAEKKPPHNEWVLLSVKDRVLVGRAYTHPSCATMYESINNCHISECDILAWMPLPTPYQMGGDE